MHTARLLAESFSHYLRVDLGAGSARFPKHSN